MTLPLIPLTKLADPGDYVELAEELQIVDRWFTSESEQHTMRRWEYAVAMHAYGRWCEGAQIGGPIYDVGGSGSPFYRMLDPWQMSIIDPKEQDGTDLALYLQTGARLGAAVFCLSVLEHIEHGQLDRFLYHLSCLVAPGGLLFLTMDYDCTDPGVYGAPVDHFHFHWMRKRIFNLYTLQALVIGPLVHLGFNMLGDVDLSPRPTTVYNYTFASLALIKRS